MKKTTSLKYLIREEPQDIGIPMSSLKDIPPGKDGRFWKYKKCRHCGHDLRSKMQRCVHCGLIVSEISSEDNRKVKAKEAPLWDKRKLRYINQRSGKLIPKKK